MANVQHNLIISLITDGLKQNMLFKVRPITYNFDMVKMFTLHLKKILLSFP